MIIEHIDTQAYARVYALLKKIGKYYTPSLDTQIKNLDNYVKKIVIYSDIFIAIDNTNDIGLLSIYCNNDTAKKAFISTIGVDANYNGQGIAQNLLDLVITHVKNQNFLTIELEVYKQNFRAIAFYQKNGFVTSKNNNTSIFMELKLI